MPRPLALLATLALCAIAVAGCGQSFPLPTETPKGSYPADKDYHLEATWGDMEDIADILLTQGLGSQLFMLFKEPPGGVGTAPRGAVYAFAINAEVPTDLAGVEFDGLFVPTALCEAPHRVFVLDEGDTTLARDPVTGKVGDLSVTWRVKEYGLLGGDPISTFTDTSMAFVRGIAADNQGRIYVSGAAKLVIVDDPNKPAIRTRLFQSRVYRYKPVSPGSVPLDPDMPGTDRWVRDRTYEVEEGSGVGSLMDPRGLYWAGTGVPGGPALFAADFGKNWAQKLSDAQSSLGFFMIEFGDPFSLDAPEDVAVDLDGNIYVADTGNQRVLRYDSDGQFVQTVSVEPETDGLQQPVAVAADQELVFVGDRGAGRVLRYRRRR